MAYQYFIRQSIVRIPAKASEERTVSHNAGALLDGRIDDDRELQIGVAISNFVAGGYDSPMANALRQMGVESGLPDWAMMPAVDFLIETLIENTIP